MTEAEIDALRRDRDNARAELARLRTERDQLRVNQLEVPEPPSDIYAELAALRSEVARLSVRAADLQRELDAHRTTVSWRITAPLRRFRTRR
jgi:predicted  nucleic acid-binding Zn-ribbon protein